MQPGRTQEEGRKQKNEFNRNSKFQGRLPAHGCNVQNTGGTLSVLVLFLLGSFILPKAQIPVWWSWGYLISPRCFQLKFHLHHKVWWMNEVASGNVTSLGNITNHPVCPPGVYHSLQCSIHLLTLVVPRSSWKATNNHIRRGSK
ncbi:hypothetical protein Q3G72_028643 [Acer saccharum]|nr:hypothetical protein Q3G72_028643 [Acer saccharum]